VLVTNLVTQRPKKITKVLTCRKGVHLVGHDTGYVMKDSSFDIVEEEDRLVHTNAHPKCFAKRAENYIKCHPFEQGTSSKENNIIHEKEVGQGKRWRYFDSSDKSIHPSIINQKTEPFNYK